MEQTEKVKSGIAVYLKQFETSPYSYPTNDRQVVAGTSTLKGSWRSSSN